MKCPDMLTRHAADPGKRNEPSLPGGQAHR